MSYDRSKWERYIFSDFERCMKFIMYPLYIVCIIKETKRDN